MPAMPKLKRWETYDNAWEVWLGEEMIGIVMEENEEKYFVVSTKVKDRVKTLGVHSSRDEAVDRVVNWWNG